MKCDHVKAWQECVTIPTYGIGKPEKNPLFQEKRVYQGSSGVVYPYPVIEKITDEKIDKEYTALFLENRYLKIMVLPELGGRIQMAYDKIRQRHFIYYNQVIKPALVGLAGPWISGGIEFNWPQHHRPSTFLPVDFEVMQCDDGSAVVRVSEVERMFNTKGMASFRLYPDKAYLEIEGRLYNRTPFVQTFLWWANPAVKVNDHYQTVFPPDVHAVFDHGKRDVSAFPIARGTYYKVDYSKGVDISLYKNIPVPTSYMAIASRYDFMGGYEHDTKGGLLHVADHHISPGKKQWTWGNGDFGASWIRNLTDEDGPYIELMTGVFTDNQPDFSWLQPYEERSFRQYFMPYSEIGIVKNATKEAAVNLEINGKVALLQLYTTASYADVVASLEVDGKRWWSEILSVSPEYPYKTYVPLPPDFTPTSKVHLIFTTAKDTVLVDYTVGHESDREVPKPATAPGRPSQVASVEELYLTGLHLEQYRHATYRPSDYYREALDRDPGDVRCNNAMGRMLLRQGQFRNAEAHFRRAIATLTARNPNPADGEPFFNLGMSLFFQDRWEEAYEQFFKATWNGAWQDVAFFYLARIAVRNKRLDDAMQFVEASLVRNDRHHSARHLKATILRESGRYSDAFDWIDASLALDPFNFGCMFEKYLVASATNPVAAPAAAGEIVALARGNANTYLAYALDYAHAGRYAEAIRFLQLDERVEASPMIHYYQAYFSRKQSDPRGAPDHHLQLAMEANSDYCFPNNVEDVIILLSAMQQQPQDSRAPYYLGNFWYAHRHYDEAIWCWELSAETNPDFPTVHRNLALAYFNKRGDAVKALKALERAFRLNEDDERVLMELDQLYKRLNRSHDERLALLEHHPALVDRRDDLFLERVTLYNHLELYAVAGDLLASRRFHPWEGGEGKTIMQYRICNVERARLALDDGNCRRALELLEEARVYPENLGEGKLPGTAENDIFYLMGCAYEMIGEQARAKSAFEAATSGRSEPAQAIFYNDQPPDMIFYMGLAWEKLGDSGKARGIFERLIEFSLAHMNDDVSIDYFAVSLPDMLVFDQDLTIENRVHCHYLAGLGRLGMKDAVHAAESFDMVLKLNNNHFGAAIHKRVLDRALAGRQSK